MEDGSCAKCQWVKENLKNGVWVHRGMGELNPINENRWESLKDGDVVNDFFLQPPALPKNDIWSKPGGPGGRGYCIWFSAGSWLYDCFSDQSCEYHMAGNIDGKYVTTSSLNNVLTVTNKEEMIAFTEKYSEYGLWDKMDPKINWNRVASEYYGVAFTFKRTCDIGFPFTEPAWHYGWDVESLVVFDLRAFNHITVRYISV